MFDGAGAFLSYSYSKLCYYQCALFRGFDIRLSPLLHYVNCLGGVIPVDIAVEGLAYGSDGNHGSVADQSGGHVERLS